PGAWTQRSTSASSLSPHCASTITLPGDCSPTVSADLAGGLTTDSISTVIRMKPPSISSAVSSQTVRVSSSMEVAQQPQVDLQPEVGGDAEQRGIERDVHAVDHRGDHGLDLVGVGRTAVAGGRKGDEGADDRAEEADADHVGRDPLHVVPALQEDADDPRSADADDQPAKGCILAFERLAGQSRDPQAEQKGHSDRLQD